MPIRIPDQLPARDILVSEGVQVMNETEAARQDIRPLSIALLNLMPNKISTETQIARLIGASPIQVELTLVRAGSHESKTTSREHLTAFYKTWEEVQHEKFDGFIVTGAPVGKIAYEDITFWPEVKKIFDWTESNVTSSLFVCWGAMAAAYHFHGIQKHYLDAKYFGVFPHRNCRPNSPFLVGFSDEIEVPVSRWTTLAEEDILASDELRLLLSSERTGPCLFREDRGRRLYMINHLEYDATTLADEYRRDLEKGTAIEVPENYFPDNDPERMPLNRWRAHGALMFQNWINQIYQSTPFDVADIGRS